MTTPERRKAARVVVTGRINVSSLDSRAAIHLADLSPGGFSVRSSEALPVGQVLRFHFSAPPGVWAVSLTARSIYCRQDSNSPADAPGFYVGFQFINTESATAQARIHQLVEHATTLATFS